MAKKKKTKKKRSYNKRSLIKEIMKIFRLNPKKTFNYRQISKEIGLKNDGVNKMIIDILHELHEQDRLVLIDRGKYRYKKTTTTIEGSSSKYSSTSSLSGFKICLPLLAASLIFLL